MIKKLLFVLLFFVSAISAQHREPYFKTLNVENGLPEEMVQTKLEDKNGYLWMGTQNGLVRYDGYTLKPYLMFDEKGRPIPANSIRELLQGKDGKIWAFTFENGIHYYDQKSDRFVKVAIDKKTSGLLTRTFIFGITHDEKDHAIFLTLFYSNTMTTSLVRFDTADYSLTKVTSVFTGKTANPIKNQRLTGKDASGKIWMASDNNLSFYEASSKTFQSYFTLHKKLKGINIMSVDADVADRDILWLITDSIHDFRNTPPVGRHLLRFNSRTKAYQIFTANPKDAKGMVSNCTKIIVDEKKRQWFLCGSTIARFDAKTNTFINYKTDFNGELDAAAADKSGNIWIGGNSPGLGYLDIKTKKVIWHTATDAKGSLPNHTNISELFHDRSGTLWVNMPFSGIAYADARKTIFSPRKITLDPEIVKTENQSKFNIVGGTGDTFYLKNENGLNVWHVKADRFDAIDLRQKDVYKKIRCATTGTDGSIWIGTSGFGILRYDPKTKSIENLKNDTNDERTISSNYIAALTVGEDGILWIATSNKGLSSFDPISKKATRYPYRTDATANQSTNALDSDEPLAFTWSKDGLLWIGTDDGCANSFDTKTGKFKSYKNKEIGFFCVPSMLEDSRGRFWVGTYMSGLFLLDRKTGKTKNYTEQDGLLHNSIMGIAEDNSGSIWCLSARGLSKLDPETNRFTVITGVTKDLLDRGVGHFSKDSEGNLIYSVKDGIVRFDPMDLKPNPVAPFAIIESINYRADDSKEAADTTLYVKNNQNITLKFDENKITFNFVALQFANASNNQYAYQMIGYDKDWVAAGTQRTTTYTNLSPGTYTFKVKAANGDGVWNEKAASLTLTILPPWWKTWWAYLLYLLVFVIGISTYIAVRSAALKRENRILEDKVALRTSQLESSITNLKTTQSQLIQSEKMASLGELTAGIAHEIQNPLNFVNNFSDVSNELVDEIFDERRKTNDERNESLVDDILSDIKQNLSKISHHGKRADAIVKGMLQHSRSTSGEKELTDLNALADEYLRLAYHGLRAKDKSFNAELITNFAENLPKVKVIPQDIGRVLLNLITNAFYATQ
ncbi:MAG: hypothetical protein EOO50_17310, partial [Flavobacterium sp.]|uniref:ligand-binding sensor domain-containing protein n=1 Tax=Flavobacterium sp. TaxID=239 RepID=UPI00120593A5